MIYGTIKFHNQKMHAVSLVLFLTLNFNYCWLTVPAGLCKTPSGTLDTNTLIHGFPFHSSI